jgi:hypothetical protein
MKAGQPQTASSHLRGSCGRIGLFVLGTVLQTASLVALFLLTGCAYALRPYNSPSQQRLQVISTSPERWVIRVAEIKNYPVGTNGYVTFDVPRLPRGCAVYLFGVVKIADARSEDVRAIQLVRDGTLVRKLSLRQIYHLPTDGHGYPSIVLR